MARKQVGISGSIETATWSNGLEDDPWPLMIETLQRIADTLERLLKLNEPMKCDCGKQMMQSSMQRYQWFCLKKQCRKVWELKEVSRVINGKVCINMKEMDE